MPVAMLGISNTVESKEIFKKLVSVFDKTYLEVVNIPFVFLKTCNRLEIYFSTEDIEQAYQKTAVIFKVLLENKEEIKTSHFYAFYDIDCFEHLIRVASGLESVILGESEIQHQVRLAYEVAASQKLSKELHFIFQKALAISKKIRSDYLSKAGTLPNLASTLFDLGLEHATKNNLDRQNIKCLFVGASHINGCILEYFYQRNLKKNLFICNRSFEKAEVFKDKFNMQIHPWEERDNWNEYHWVIVAVSFKEYLFEKKIFERITDNKLVVDLGMPSNIEPLESPLLYNIENMHEMVKLKQKSHDSLIETIVGLINEKIDFYREKIESRQKCA